MHYGLRQRFISVESERSLLVSQCSGMFRSASHPVKSMAYSERTGQVRAPCSASLAELQLPMTGRSCSTVSASVWGHRVMQSDRVSHLFPRNLHWSDIVQFLKMSSSVVGRIARVLRPSGTTGSCLTNCVHESDISRIRLSLFRSSRSVKLNRWRSSKHSREAPAFCVLMNRLLH